MTTIAYDRDARVVASDSQETGDGGQKYNCQKLFQTNSHVIATAGGSYAGMAFVRWFDLWEGEPDWEDCPDYINLDADEDFECLVISSDSSCYTVNRLFIPIEQGENKIITLGSGGAAARGAMLSGASPVRAVQIACQIDTYSGGKIQTMSI